MPPGMPIARGPGGPSGRPGTQQQAWPQGVFWREDFEVDPLAYAFPTQVGSTAVIDTAHASNGTQSLKLHKTGAASGSIRTFSLPRSLVVVGRFKFWGATLPTASFGLQNIIAGVLTAINISTAGNLAGGWSGATISSGVNVCDSAWHAIDFRVDYRGATWRFDWMLDGVAQTQATVAASGAGPTQWKFDVVGAITLDCWVDQWQLSDGWYDYPLSDVPPPPSSPTNATITLTTNSVTANATLNRQPGRVLAPSVVTATAALVRMPTKALTASQATAAALLSKLASHTFTPSTATASATLAKTPGKPLTASQATASATLTRTPVKALTAGATAAASLVRLPGKVLTAGATASAQLVKMPGHVFTASVATASAVLTTIKVKTLALTTSVVTASASLVKTAGHVLTTSPATASATLSRVASHVFTSSAATASASLIRTAGHVFAASIATASATLRRTPVKALTSSPATATATITKQPAHTLTTNVATASASVSKRPSRTLTTSTATASAQLRRAPIRVLTASATATANLVTLIIHGTTQWPPVASVLRAFMSRSNLDDAKGPTGHTRGGSSGPTDAKGPSGRTDL